jgi:hypothetical protein
MTLALAQQENISVVLSFAHISGKACGKHWKSNTNLSAFNVMMRFAPFLCNRVSRGNFCQKISERFLAASDYRRAI